MGFLRELLNGADGRISARTTTGIFVVLNVLALCWAAFLTCDNIDHIEVVLGLLLGFAASLFGLTTLTTLNYHKANAVPRDLPPNPER
jgi:hypothetical protein